MLGRLGMYLYDSQHSVLCLRLMTIWMFVPSLVLWTRETLEPPAWFRLSIAWSLFLGRVIIIHACRDLNKRGFSEIGSF